MENTTPLVSIITPNFNCASTIEDTINSVLAQNYPNIEFIIVDGASSDKSTEIINRYMALITHFISEPDTGQASAINKGLRLARGDYVGWLNSDDRLLPDCISRVISQFQRDPSIHLVYGDVFIIDDSGSVIGRSDSHGSGTFSPATMLVDRQVIQPGSLWIRSLMETVGYLNEEYHYVMDYDYWVRAALTGGKFFRLPPPPIAHFRRSVGSKTTTATVQFGLEELRVHDFIAAHENIQERLGLSNLQFSQHMQQARAHTMLKVSSGYLRQKKLSQGVSWMLKAFRLFPKSIITRRRLWIGSLRQFLQSTSAKP